MGRPRQSVLALLAWFAAMGFAAFLLYEGFASPGLAGHPRSVGAWELAGFACGAAMHIFGFLAWVRIRSDPRRLRGGGPLLGAGLITGVFWAGILVRVVLEVAGSR